MGRSPCCDDESSVKKGPWTPEEDEKLIHCITKHGHGSWRTVAKRAGLNRCGKSCRLRWTNYLRPDIKRGKFTEDEDRIIINLHSVLGNKWSKIAAHLPGRTDNEIKNYWNTHIRKELLKMGIDPETHKPRTDFNHLMNLSHLLGNISNTTTNWASLLTLQPHDITQLAKIQLLQNLLQIMNNNSFANMPNQYHLLANPNFSPLLNSINIGNPLQIQTKEPMVLNGEEYANPAGLYSKAQSSECSHKDVSKSSPQDVDYNKISSGAVSGENQAENPLPALIASSPGMGTFNQMESGCNTADTSTQSPCNKNNTIFDDWEKFLDDETNGSYWKEILDLTSNSASPLLW